MENPFVVTITFSAEIFPPIAKEKQKQQASSLCSQTIQKSSRNILLTQSRSSKRAVRFIALHTPRFYFFLIRVTYLLGLESSKIYEDGDGVYHKH